MSYNVPYQHAKRSEGGATEDDWETFPEEPPEAKDWIPDPDGIPAPSGPPSFRSNRYGYAAEESGMDVLRRQARHLDTKRARSMSSSSSGTTKPDSLLQSESVQAASQRALGISPAAATEGEDGSQTDGSLTRKAGSSKPIPTLTLSTSAQSGSAGEDAITAMAGSGLSFRGRIDSNSPVVGAVSTRSAFNMIIAKTLAAADEDDNNGGGPNLPLPHRLSSSTNQASTAITMATGSEYIPPNIRHAQETTSEPAKLEAKQDGALSPEELVVQESHRRDAQAATEDTSDRIDPSRQKYGRMMETRMIKMMEGDMGLEAGATMANLLNMSKEKFKNYANSVKSDHYMWYMTEKGALI